MLPNNKSNNEASSNWMKPNEVMALQRLKLKKKQLQARMNKTSLNASKESQEEFFPTTSSVQNKRRNPFLKSSESKRSKPELDESSDQTLFKLLHLNNTATVKSSDDSITSFSNILSRIQESDSSQAVEVAVGVPKGELWIPIDWCLKSKMRLISRTPFAWNQKLKVSEEASGITAFTRCLDTETKTTLDTSPNAKFHQCCLFWQQPYLPWLSLFPRTIGRSAANGTTITSVSGVKDSLQGAWSDSLRSLFQLVRTRQCPYFYICANSFTILFRAAGVCGNSEINAMITPTTRGFRQTLRQEDIEFAMPLKKHNRQSDQGYETLDSVTTASEEEAPVEDDEIVEDQWLQSLGANAEDIKRINCAQTKMVHKSECDVDNSQQSLIYIEGVEVNALYNFLINCKSTVAATGSLAGIPPSLLAPVSFHGASLSSLKVRESKVRADDKDYYSIELTGPILPHAIHNLCEINPEDRSVTATFANVASTAAFSSVRGVDQSEKENSGGGAVFGKENLSDCGLHAAVLKHFCSGDVGHVRNIECLKYTSETKTYTWS